MNFFSIRKGLKVTKRTMSPTQTAIGPLEQYPEMPGLYKFCGRLSMTIEENPTYARKRNRKSDT